MIVEVPVWSVRTAAKTRSSGLNRVVCVATVLSPFSRLPSWSVLILRGGRQAPAASVRTITTAVIGRLTFLM